MVMPSPVPSSSGYRPADVGVSSEPQRIPRRIMQTGFTFSDALRTHRDLMEGWWRINPEYAYQFFSDEQAVRFVQTHASSREQEAYGAVRTGAQKADLFRVIALRYAGGVYADADMELRRPLRDVLPRNASAVLGRFWGSEFLAFEAGHPLMIHALRTLSGNVHRQLRWMRAGNTSAHCGSAHSCVLTVSGPFALRQAFASAARSLGCKLGGSIDSAVATTEQCPPVMRRVHVCTRDTGNVYRTWACDAAYHWDCRNSGGKRKCSTNHYSKIRRGSRAAFGFFNVSAGLNATIIRRREYHGKSSQVKSREYHGKSSQLKSREYQGKSSQLKSREFHGKSSHVKPREFHGKLLGIHSGALKGKSSPSKSSQALKGSASTRPLRRSAGAAAKAMGKLREARRA